MKNYFILACILSIGTILFSCQDEKDDCIYLDKRRCDPNYVFPDIEEGLVTLTSPIVNYDSRILLEDFTGFACTNCLPATITAANLKAANPNRLSIVGVHCTPTFAGPQTNDPNKPYFKDFRTPEGEEFVTYYGFSGLPTGAINRLGNGTTKYISYNEWTDRVNELLSENNPEVYISIENITIDEANQKLIVDVHAKPLRPTTESYLINLSVVESNIPEAQKNSSSPGGEILDYIHNHVFRGSAYGPWGLDIFSGEDDIRSDKAIWYKLKMDINPEWELDNCEILVFISKSSNREVVQVEEAHL